MSWIVFMLILFYFFTSASAPKYASYRSYATPDWGDYKDSGLFGGSRGTLIMEGNSKTRMGGIVVM